MSRAVTFLDKQKYEIVVQMLSGKASQGEVSRRYGISAACAYKSEDRAGGAAERDWTAGGTSQRKDRGFVEAVDGLGTAGGRSDTGDLVPHHSPIAAGGNRKRAYRVTREMGLGGQMKEEVCECFTGEDYEPYEMAYFKLYESQLPVVEQALYVASRMVGTERSRGYCLELTCADFLAGRTEESTPEEILLLIHRLVGLLPPDYQARLAGKARGTELEPAQRC